jgi:hypothetical protein
MLALSACSSSLTQTQDATSKFSNAAHTISTSEIAFFRAVQTADCNNQFYNQALKWATGSAANFDITGACTPTVLTDAQIQNRQILMTTITLYADQIAALASSDNDKSLDRDSRDLARKINAVAKRGWLKNISTAGEVEGAVIAIAQMVLDPRIYSDIRAAAQAMDPWLRKLVVALQNENSTIAANPITSKLGGVESTMRTVTAMAPRADPTARFFYLVQARAIMQGVNPMGSAPVAESAGAIEPTRVADKEAALLNAALDAVVRANQAIQNATTGGTVAAVNDLIARAQAAQAMQAALIKS